MMQGSKPQIVTIHSIAKLDYVLDKQLSWRKKELTRLRFAVETAPEDEGAVLRRAAVALIYAHWEGFVKEAGSGFLELIASQQRFQFELTDNLVALARRKELRELGRSARVSRYGEMIKKVKDSGRDVLRIPWKDALDTQSNLDFGTLREVLYVLGLDELPYKTMAKPVIDALVTSRNGIAHGEGLPVTAELYTRVHDGTLLLLDKFRDQISDAAANETYLNVNQ